MCKEPRVYEREGTYFSLDLRTIKIARKKRGCHNPKVKKTWARHNPSNLLFDVESNPPSGLHNCCRPRRREKAHMIARKRMKVRVLHNPLNSNLWYRRTITKIPAITTKKARVRASWIHSSTSNQCSFMDGGRMDGWDGVRVCEKVKEVKVRVGKERREGDQRRRGMKKYGVEKKKKGRDWSECARDSCNDIFFSRVLAYSPSSSPFPLPSSIYFPLPSLSLPHTTQRSREKQRKRKMGDPKDKKKEIYTYEAPWPIYGMNWSSRGDKPYRLFPSLCSLSFFSRCTLLSIYHSFLKY